MKPANGSLPGLAAPVLLDKPKSPVHPKFTNEVHLNPRLTWAPSIDDVAPNFGIRTNDGEPPAALGLAEQDADGNTLVRQYALNQDQARWLRDRLAEYLDGPAADPEAGQ